MIELWFYRISLFFGDASEYNIEEQSVVMSVTTIILSGLMKQCVCVCMCVLIRTHTLQVWQMVTTE